MATEPIVAAVAALLQRAPRTWEELDVDALPHVEEEALFQLTAAGLVERRYRFRATMVNHPVSIEGTVTSTGEYGFAEAMKGFLPVAWSEWSEAFQQWQVNACRVPVRFDLVGKHKWRLTDQGELAVADLRAGSLFAIDFVLRRGSLPTKYRDPVRGFGSIAKVHRNVATTASVGIANWEEGAAQFAKAFFERFGGIAEQPARVTPQRQPPASVDLRKKTVTVNGQSFDVNSEQALRWVKVLIDHPGEWISAAELSRHDPELLGVRTDKVKAALPENVSKLIDSETGKGSRIRLA